MFAFRLGWRSLAKTEKEAATFSSSRLLRAVEKPRNEVSLKLKSPSHPPRTPFQSEVPNILYGKIPTWNHTQTTQMTAFHGEVLDSEKKTKKEDSSLKAEWLRNFEMTATASLRSHKISFLIFSPRIKVLVVRWLFDGWQMLAYPSLARQSYLQQATATWLITGRSRAVELRKARLI
jgi:hypothetical protein